MENTALSVIKKAEKEGALVFVKPEDIQTQRMFIPQVTTLSAGPHDFHDRPINGRYMPKAHHVDRIGEAAGIEFIASECGTRKDGDNTYVGFAQGRRRLPDGTYRTSSKQEYEFDVDVRAEEDFLKDSKGNYNSDIAKRKHIIELKKVARQRASTGARLRVIRELVGIPIAFGREDFKRALVVHRIAVNTDLMLEDPETRQAALDLATGASRELFGPATEQAQIEAPSESFEDTSGNDHDGEVLDISDAQIVDDDDFTLEGEKAASDPVDEAKMKLEEWLNVEAVKNHRSSQGKSAGQAIQELIGDEGATLEQCNELIEKLSNVFGQGVRS